MRKKKDCAECGNVHSASSLHRSMEDHKMLCHNCYRVENRNRLAIKLKHERDLENELGNSTEKRKRLSRMARLFKFGSGLIRGMSK